MIKLDEKYLTITYTGGINPELDQKLRELLEPLGWKWQGSGQNIKTGQRDFSFYKE